MKNTVTAVILAAGSGSRMGLDITKQKISQKLKGRMKSPSHCQAISNGLKAMWDSIPKKEDDSTEGGEF